jgi:hypothetical protein
MLKIRMLKIEDGLTTPWKSGASALRLAQNLNRGFSPRGAFDPMIEERSEAVKIRAK